MKYSNQNQSCLLESCYVENYKYLYNFGQLKLSDKEHLKDLIQETFIVAIENLGNFRQQSNLKTWLIGILKRKIFDYYRNQKRVGMVFTESLDQIYDNDSFNEILALGLFTTQRMAGAMISIIRLRITSKSV